MAQEQRVSPVVDAPLVTGDMTSHQTAVSPTTPRGFSSSYSSEYSTKTVSMTDQMNPSTSQPSTPLRTANQSQHAVWKPFQEPGHVAGVPSSYQSFFAVKDFSPTRTHVVTKPAGPPAQILAKTLAAAFVSSSVSQTTVSQYSGVDASDSPSLALKRKAELAEHLKPVHSFKKVKLSETGSGALMDNTSSPKQPRDFDDGQSKRLTSQPEGVLANPGNVTPPTSGKRTISRRPKGQVWSQVHEQKGPTRLRTNRPVAAEIPFDVWGLVLSYCPLDFLFKARLISNDFKNGLSYDSTWRNTRIMNYGPDMPGPPDGMSEMQYANLLVGQSCMSCGDKKTRKTYWAFLRRWCNKCLKEKVILERACLGIKAQYPKIFQCIPHASFDSFQHFENSGTYPTPPVWTRNSQAHVIGYEVAKVSKKIKEIEEFLRVEPGELQKTDEEVEAWYNPQIEANKNLVLQIQAVEDWDNTRRLQRLEDTKLHKNKRAEYYREQAKNMVPPLEPEALVLTQSYIRAVDIPKAPSERSWQILEKKLKKERAEAEGIVRAQKDEENLIEHRQQCIDMYRTLAERRAKNDTVEQIAVLAAADAVIESLKASNVLDQIADVDIIHVILRQVHKRYYAAEDAPGPEHNTNGYRLLLADAKMVYERKIEPIINGWNDEARSKVAKMLKCRGCVRRDIQHRFTWDQLFCHIARKHAPDIGDFRQLHVPIAELPGSVTFPWCRLEWPKNLPMLAEHHTATGKWDPQDDSEYQEAPRAKKVTASHAAYAGRSVSREAGPPDLRFVDNVMYAVSLLRPTPLDAKFKTCIAFTFALNKYGLVAGETPLFDVLIDLQLALVRGGHYDLFEHFRCHTCCQQSNPAKNNKFVNKGQPFGELVEHYRACHSPGQWTTHMLKLPSPEELWSALSEHGMHSALQVFEQLFPMKEEANIDPVLRGGHIAPVAHMG